MKATILKVRWFGRKMWGMQDDPWSALWRHCRDEGPVIVYHYNGLDVVDNPLGGRVLVVDR